ncbi:MAG: 16S rRNA (cytosine(1402)-N(4))-methyltransferase RsmH [Eubacterium sp.]|nr:16S rRNA (cytosine(1402)-N(4))-methyltransferase RsmH [Eubacterium sp.]MBQ9022376.1 16S rRNA (cytosine(1402)-N(4))-methyltransferase RsmH [Eubacterium sp.]
MEFKHKTVLLTESVDNLITDPDGIYVDGTLGGAGHSMEICKRLTEKGRLIGFDQDAEAIKAASERLAQYQNKVTILHSNFSQMKRELEFLGVEEVNGILLDLGVSSHQLDTLERGFSYRDEEAPLDMRMDTRQAQTAQDILMTYSEDELTRILKEYGEERFARNIARNIVSFRETNTLETTGQLNEIIRRSIPAKNRNSGGHPSKRTFQAIRIELNRELDVLKENLSDMIGLLAPGGRLCVITFHSLEDRIVKTIFKEKENPCTCPPNFPVCVCGKVPQGRMLTRKPILPSEEELNENSRSKSAKLRVFEKKQDS